MACVIRSDDSLFCLGRPGLGMLRASNWRNISTYSPWKQPRGSIRGEDPMVWIDQDNSSVLHAVTHGGGWGQPFGFHYWSTDGGESWKDNNAVKVYSNVVMLANGGNKTLSRRERPHVVLDKAGVPIALTNGVTEAWPCTLVNPPVPDKPGLPGSNGTGIWCPVDYCYTLYQTLMA